MKKKILLILSIIISVVVHAQNGHVYSPLVFDVTKPPYNADPTFTNDAGAAIQAAILADSACGGCAVVYIPNGHYKISKSFDNNCNCQIRIPATNPYITAFDPVIKIYGQSVSTVGAEGYSVTLTPLPTNGVILQSTIAGTGSIPCVFGTYFNPHTFQYTDLEMKDLNVRGYTNHGTAPITSTYFNLKFSATFKLDRIIGCADTINQATVDPSTTEVAGLMAGNFDDNGPNNVSNCIMTAVKYGFIIGEHTELHNDYAIADDYGLVGGAISYPLTGRFLTHACKHALLVLSHTIFGDYLGSGGCALGLNWDQEEDVAGFWYDYVNDFIDSSNRSTGYIYVFAADSTGSAPMNNFGCAKLNLIKTDSAYQTSSFKVINNGGNNPVTGFSNGIVAQGLDSTKYAEFQLINNKGYKFVIQEGGSSSSSGAQYSNTAALVNFAPSGNILLGTSSQAIAMHIFNNGNTAIGSAPDNARAVFQLPAGTTSLASINIPTGTLTTSPLAGNLENNGTNLFFTEGSTRLQLTNQSGVPGGTNGAIQFNLSGAMGGNSSELSYNTTAGSTNGYIGIGIASSPAPLVIDRPFVTGRGQFSIQDSSNAGSASIAFQSFYDNTNTRIGLIGFPAYTANDSNMNISNYQTNGGVWIRNGSTILSKFTSAGTLIMPSMATGGTAPVTSGTTKCVIVDANGLYSFASCSGGGGGLTPGGPTNSLQINNGSTGNLSGFASLVYDSVHNRLGIGGAPAAPFEINTPIVATRGQLSIQDSSHNGVNSLAYISMFGNNNTRIGLFGFGQYGGSSDPNYYEVNENGGTIAWRNSSATIGQFTNAGLFGIGSTTPTVNLHVASAVNGGVEGRIENTTAGTGAFSRFSIKNDAAKSLNITEISSAFTNSGLIIQNSAQIYNNGAGGLLVATNSAPLQFSVDGEVSVAAQYFSSKNYGIGSTTDNSTGLIQSTSTSQSQLALHYDATHYSQFQTGSGGNLTITPTGSALTLAAGVFTGLQAYNGAYGTSLITSNGTTNDPITAASGTVATMAINRFQVATESATNTGVVYTNSYNVAIDGAPTSGTHVTQTNSYAFGVLGGASTFNAGQFLIQGSSNWNPAGTITGSRISLNLGTLTDNVGSGTVSNAYVMGLTTPILAASSAVTYTNAYSLYLNAAPSASTNVTITNAYALGVGGNALFQGQLSTGSIALSGWQTITSGTTSTVNNTQTNWLLNPASLIAAFTVTLPSAPTDGQLVKLHFGGTVSGGSTVVTALTVSPNSGQSIEQSAAITTALGGNCYIYQYNAALSTWYREQ